MNSRDDHSFFLDTYNDKVESDIYATVIGVQEKNNLKESSTEYQYSCVDEFVGQSLNRRRLGQRSNQARS